MNSTSTHTLTDSEFIAKCAEALAYHSARLDSYSRSGFQATMLAEMTHAHHYGRRTVDEYVMSHKQRTDAANLANRPGHNGVFASKIYGTALAYQVLANLADD